jgi:hypothetical protein
MDLNQLTILALQRLNQSLNHHPQRAIPEVALPEIDYAVLAAHRLRTKRAERGVYADRGGLVTPAGVAACK